MYMDDEYSKCCMRCGRPLLYDSEILLCFDCEDKEKAKREALNKRDSDE